MGTTRRDAIRSMLAARSVAVVGATDNRGSPGFRLLSYLIEFGYGGAIYPVNPRQSECQGLKCYADLRSLPEVPDLIGVAVAAHRVPDVLREAADRGVAAAVVISAGFAEAGPEGAALQEEIAEIDREHGILVCGPNSVGITSTSNDLALTFTEALTRGGLATGDLGMVSQSGAFGTVLYAQARERGIGVNTYLSSGNEASTGVGDYIEALVEESSIGVVGAYIEGLRDATALERAATRARALDKPIVALKVGRSERAGQAAASHTGSMIGNDVAYRKAFERMGIIAVDDEQELLDVASALPLVRETPPWSNRVAIISTSGGAGVLLTDMLDERGLQLAEVSNELESKLRELLPDYASFANPIDVTGRFVTDPSGLEDVIQAVASDPGVDLVIVFIGLAWSNSQRWEAAFKAARDCPTPIVVSAPLLDSELADRLSALNVPVCSSLRRTAAVCSAMVRWGTWTPPVAGDEPVNVLHDTSPAELPSGVIDEDRSKALLESLDIPVPRGRIATSTEEAGTIAAEFDGQVVLKVIAENLTHKSEFGAVAVDIAPEDVRARYAAMVDEVEQSAPSADVSGVRVEEMVAGDLELFIGAVRAEPFGILIAVGAGGTEVELKKDVAYGLAPLSYDEACAMLRSLNTYPLLRGYRGRPPLDVDAVAKIVERVSRLAADLGDRLVEMDLNPVVVREHGAVVLDALLVLEQ